jgi:hypothetical protein
MKTVAKEMPKMQSVVLKRLLNKFLKHITVIRIAATRSINALSAF